MKLSIIGQWGGFPAKNGASSGYLLQHKGFNMLLDCGSGVLSKLQNIIKPEELSAVIISHYHPDHIADIGVLQHALLISHHLGNQVKTLPIYAHNENDSGFASLTYKKLSKGIAYFETQPLIVGPFTISFIRTNHPVPCFAMNISDGEHNLIYTADSAYMASFVSFSRDADILLCECNFYKGMNGKSAGHMTSEEAGMLAKKANVKQLILTHLPHFGDHHQLQYEAKEQFNGPIQIAHQNLTVTL
ncbi:MBL fold metallo-hydrolase [Bacillus sp. 2205SS5-2]|uniref:MBL fold metallo-hydrolase n=1 Tax=Bacillus sp. 2205SS5-2 TaxID=3109031 RepID=UPI003004FD88